MPSPEQEALRRRVTGGKSPLDYFRHTATTNPKSPHYRPSRKNDDPENRATDEAKAWLTERGVFFFRVDVRGKIVGYDEWGHAKRAPADAKGVSDLIAVIPGHGGVFIEMKRFDGKGVQSDDQKEFQRNVEANGGIYCLVESIADLERLVGPLLPR